MAVLLLFCSGVKLSCAGCEYSTALGNLMAKHLIKFPSHSYCIFTRKGGCSPTQQNINACVCFTESLKLIMKNCLTAWSPNLHAQISLSASFPLQLQCIQLYCRCHYLHDYSNNIVQTQSNNTFKLNCYWKLISTKYHCKLHLLNNKVQNDLKCQMDVKPFWGINKKCSFLKY